MPRAAPKRARRPIVEVLRIGHRLGRDPRLTTHLALTARAFGADRLYLHPPDAALAERIGAISRRWGGQFAIEGVREWKPVVRRAGACVVHLTMYGEPLKKVESRLRREPHVLVVVGGAKVPAELYGMANLNVAVGHQPHSEVAALAILLDRLRGVPGPGAWPGAEQVIVPMARGKKVMPATRSAA
jgi:tRNA (cytidine56-2'-O)-methyltransferase